MTREFFKALCDDNQKTEVWMRRGFCNNSELRVLVSGRKRFAWGTEQRVTKKWLESKYIQVR